MDPFSVIVLALIYAALRAPGEAGRAVRGDYRNRRDRWSGRAESRMGGYGRARGGRRVAGYDRNGRGYDRAQRAGRRRGDQGWWRDPRAWRGREGRARVARGVRPSAIRAGIITGALAYTALFGAGVAARGFARGARGGYRLGKAHYRAKRNNAEDPTITVTPGTPGDPLDPEAETVYAVIVDDETPTPGARPGDGEPIVIVHAVLAADAQDEPAPPGPAAGGMKNGPWLLTVHGPGINRITGADTDGFAVYDAAELDRCLAVIADTPGLRAEVRPLPDPDADPAPEDSRPQSAAGSATTPGGANMPEFYNDYDWQCPECGEPVEENSPTSWTPAWGPAPTYSHLDGEPLCPVVGANGYEPAQPEPRDPRPTQAGPATNPGGTSMPENKISDQQRADNRAALKALADSIPASPVPSPAGITGQYVPVGTGSIGAPVLMEGANYDAHLHNLGVIAKEARSEYASAELTLASASAARQRAEHAMTAVEQMAVGLAAQDFGETHVGNMTSLHDLLSRHVAQARAAEQAASESLATSEQLIEMCTAAAAVFQRDHAQLAEAHANAPHAARTREAYQPL